MPQTCRVCNSLPNRRLVGQRQVEHLCRTPRLVFELLDELDRHHDLGPDLDRRLTKSTALNPKLLRLLEPIGFPNHRSASSSTACVSVRWKAVRHENRTTAPYQPVPITALSSTKPPSASKASPYRGGPLGAVEERADQP